MDDSIGIVGCGWLGRALAVDLISSRVRVVGTTRSEARVIDLEGVGVDVVRLDFTPSIRGDVSRLGSVNAVVVAIPPGRDGDPVAQAESVARMINETGASRVVQISTTSVYPFESGRFAEENAIPEHRVCLTENAYRSLDCATTILRCAGLFGPGRLILPRVLASGVAVEEESPVNLVEQRDVVRAVRRALEEPLDDVFNICADEHPSKVDFYREIARRSGQMVPEFASGPAVQRIVDNRKFKEQLAFEYAFPDPMAFPIS